VILDVVYNHTPRRKPCRADLEFSWHRTMPAYTPDRKATVYSSMVPPPHGCANCLNIAASARAAVDHGQPCVTGFNRNCTSTVPLRFASDAARVAARVDGWGPFLSRHHFIKTRTSRRESSSPNLRTWVKAVTRWSVSGRLDRMERASNRDSFAPYMFKGRSGQRSDRPKWPSPRPVRSSRFIRT